MAIGRLLSLQKAEKQLKMAYFGPDQVLQKWCFWAKIEKFYDPPPYMEKFSGRPCESVGPSSDPIRVPIGQIWHFLAILRVRLARKNVLSL